jgi:hypothetical protein
MANMINNAIKKEQMLSNLSKIYKRMGCSDDFEKEFASKQNIMMNSNEMESIDDIFMDPHEMEYNSKEKDSNKIFKETELIAKAFDEFKYGCSDDYQELADFMLFYNGHCYPRYNTDDWVDFGWSSFTGERQPNHLKIPDELLNKINPDIAKEKNTIPCKINYWLFYDGIDFTLLHWAAATGRLDIATALINNGADVNAKALMDFPPLFYAATYGYLDVAKLLVKNGADPSETYNSLTPNEVYPELDDLFKEYIGKAEESTIKTV